MTIAALGPGRKLPSSVAMTDATVCPATVLSPREAALTAKTSVSCSAASAGTVTVAVPRRDVGPVATARRWGDVALALLPPD